MRQAALAVAILIPLAACDSAVDRAFYRAFDSIQVGTPASEAVSRLGPPDEAGKEFRLGQPDGFETEYGAADASSSQRYLFWNRGVDVVCAVGLDSSDRVAYKACGGT